jgi:hypothetical protein
LKDQQLAQYWYDIRVKPKEELYRVNEDPWEYNNLAYDPRYADTLASLRNIVLERMKLVNDIVALSAKPKYLKDMQSKIPPANKILYPNCGEKLKIGDNATVVWSAEWKGTPTVKLEYFDGKKWNLIKNDLPHTGSFKWKIPSVKSSLIKLKISSENGKVWDESNRNFTITKTL